MSTYKVLGGKQYTLASSISSTQTTITLTSFTLPITDQTITMVTMGSDIAYATIAPGTSTREFISFTGITQNANGTATLTGVTRGLDPETPYTEVTAFKQPHAGQSIFILSNSPNLYNKFSIIENAETITGLKTFPGGGNVAAPVSGTVYATPTNDLEYASKKYVDDVAVAGAPDATTSVKGIIEIATQAEVVARTATGGTGASVVPTPATLTTVRTYDQITSAIGTDAYAITTTPAVAAYVTGQRFSFKADVANTGAATLDVSALGAKTIKNSAGGDLITNDIIAGQVVFVEYDGTNFQMINNSGNGEMTLAGAQTVTGVKTFSTQPVGLQNVNYQVFTSSGTWTKPSNLSGNELITVQLWGAGGGGGGSAVTQTGGAGGGGGGSYVEAKYRASDLGSTVTVTLNAGGAGGVGNSVGAVGGNSTFGSLLTAYGGGGGGALAGGTNGGSGGGGGISSVGSVGGTGTAGVGGTPLGGAATGVDSTFGGGGGATTGVGGAGVYGGGGGGGGNGGAGGASLYGGGGGGGGSLGSSGAGGAGTTYGGTGGAGGNNANGSAGVAPGGGGGGAGNLGGAAKDGGAGAIGQCRVFVNYYAN